MHRISATFLMWLWAVAIWTVPAHSLAGTVRVATFNIENYLDAAVKTRPAKSRLAKAKVQESIIALHPDILAVEEIGTLAALEELRTSLKAAGVDFPFYEYVRGFDTNIHTVILSKLPFLARVPHTNDSFLLSGRRYRVSRGFAEVTIRAAENYPLTIIAAHLKSKRLIGAGDESELRLEEAKLLREIIDSRFRENPSVKLIVLGDLNDTKESPSTKTVIGRGKTKLIDTRPSERAPNATNSAPADAESRTVAWTHFFEKEDSYSRIDYILLSPSLSAAWEPAESFVLALPYWGLASDHRPLVVTIHTPGE